MSKQKVSKLDLTIYIPVHSVADDNFENMLTEALTSIQLNDVRPERVVILRCNCKDVRETLNSMKIIKDLTDELNIEIVTNSDDKSYQGMMNFAMNECQTDFMSVLEFDDKFSRTYFEAVNQYLNCECPEGDTECITYDDVDLFLPIISEVNAEGNFQNYTNEAAWAYQFSDEMGYINHDTLLNFANISLNGMIIRTSTLREIGGFKPSFKLTFNYELLLRYTHQNNKIFVIPRVGYEHTNLRENSLFWSYKNEDKLTPQESEFWMNLAKEEYLYDYDREITYEKSALVNGEEER